MLVTFHSSTQVLVKHLNQQKISWRKACWNVFLFVVEGVGVFFLFGGEGGGGGGSGGGVCFGLHFVWYNLFLCLLLCLFLF